MSPSRPFILRPVATTLLMVAIMLSGLLAFRFLPVAALPEVDYPTIQVQTFYPGASPDVMTSSVTAPLEVQLGQMPNLNQMSSVSSAGASVITLQFGLSISLDVAEQEVQAAINAAGNLLPADLPAPPIYAKVNPADAPILTLGLTSATMPLTQVEDFVDTRLAQKISQLPGVGLVSISGGQRPAVRIRADIRKLAAYGLNIDDLRTTLGNANINTPKGNFDGPMRAYTINANDQIRNANGYKSLVVAYKNGAPVRLSDVGDVVDGAQNDKLGAWMNKVPAIILNIQRQPGANVISVVAGIKALLPQLQASLPAAIDVAVLTDRTVTIRASVRDVEYELTLAVILVVLVIFVFLRSTRATLIPSLSVPLSLIGTLGAMYLFGFSLNNLSLMALTIAAGFVVDDAIVVIENISRYIEEGETPLQAALRGSEQIGFTIISLTVSLIAVLIPLLFMGDVVGRLFREFAITLSVTILISGVVSLTLVPMACAKLLKPAAEVRENAFQRASREGFDRLIAVYGRALNWVLDRQTLVLLVALGTFVLTGLLYIAIPKGFFPLQDTGVIQAISEAPQSVSYAAMAQRQQALASAILEDPDVDSPGHGVKPQVHKNYQGGEIRLPAGPVLSPKEHPALLKAIGLDIITSDGSTLLGADDKAGVAEVMETVCRLLRDPALPHGDVKVGFTPDEETGRGVQLFNVERFGAVAAYTFDGSAVGEVESENFNAANLKVTITGRSAHTGTAKGNMINALQVAAEFISSVPANMRAETTSGYEGFIHPDEVSGNVEQVTLKVLLRDFTDEGLAQKRAIVAGLLAGLEQRYPGCKTELKQTNGYVNMQAFVAKQPQVLEIALQAVRDTGLQPVQRAIRGGTDGARLSEMGLPTPNLFTGGMNYHSRTEWACAQWMEKAVAVGVRVVTLWSGKAGN